jgi:spore coat protein A, manganese oxidase
MLTRRDFLQVGAVAAMGVLAPRMGRVGRAFAAIPGGTLDPTTIDKYVMPLVIPPAMPQTTTPRTPETIDYYEIAVRQFRQQILPAGRPPTTVWSYGSVNHPETFHAPAWTVEASVGRPVRVQWINALVDADGRYLPHLLPVDPTLHWANPPGGPAGRDMRPTFTSTPGPYTGPVPIVTHLHGGHNTQESDGFPEAWYLPAAKNIPRGYARVGSWYQTFKAEFQRQWGVAWEPGTAVFQYANDQRATTLWYHDHTLGLTRLNVYAGPAGFYLLRGGPDDVGSGVLPDPAPAPGDPPGLRYYEIPLVIQDRSFDTDGSLFYPASRAFFDGFEGPYIPDSDVPPIWNPEFFGNTMVVNGRTWPSLEVEPRRYRFRVLNACNARFLILKLVPNPQARSAQPALPFWQIGADGGFLPAPAQLAQLLLGPAERADVIVDFTGLRVGTALYLINEGPDEPFGGGVPGRDFAPADRHTTGQVLKFVVVPLASRDTSVPPDRLELPKLKSLGKATHMRQVSLNEDASTFPGFDGPIAALLGTVNTDGTGNPLEWEEPITENPTLGATEIWEMANFTEDAHPIHLHMVQFQVVERQPMGGGSTRPPERGEKGTKDTVTAFPGEINRVKATFDQAGLFVWHCHVLEHEDNQMMRPYRVMP